MPMPNGCSEGVEDAPNKPTPLLVLLACPKGEVLVEIMGLDEPLPNAWSPGEASRTEVGALPVLVSGANADFEEPLTLEMTDGVCLLPGDCF